MGKTVLRVKTPVFVCLSPANLNTTYISGCIGPNLLKSSFINIPNKRSIEQVNVVCLYV